MLYIYQNLYLQCIGSSAARGAGGVVQDKRAPDALEVDKLPKPKRRRKQSEHKRGANKYIFVSKVLNSMYLSLQLRPVMLLVI